MWHCGAHNCPGNHRDPIDRCQPHRGPWYCGCRDPICPGHKRPGNRCPSLKSSWHCGAYNCRLHINPDGTCDQEDNVCWLCGRRHPDCPKHSASKHRCEPGAAAYPYYLFGNAWYTRKIYDALWQALTLVPTFRYHDPHANKFGQIAFYTHIHFESHRLFDVLHRIQTCEILVQHNPALVGVMRFTRRHTPRFHDGAVLQNLGKPMLVNAIESGIQATDPAFGGVAVHEAVHAIHALQYPEVDALNTEMTGYIAQALYFRQSGAPLQNAHAVIRAALVVADEFLRGRQPTEAMMDHLRDSLPPRIYGDFFELWSRQPFKRAK